MGSTRISLVACFIFFSSLSLLFAAGIGRRAKEGPGLLVRNKKRYYLPPVNEKLRLQGSIPPIDLVALKQNWSTDLRTRLQKVEMLEGWQGGPLGGVGAAKRYEIAFLVGRFVARVNGRFGRVFPCPLGGPKRVRLPRISWGRREARLAVRSTLFQARGGDEWWLRAMSKGRFVRLLERIVLAMKDDLPVVSLPLRFPPGGLRSSLPWPPDPRYDTLRRVYRWGLYDIEDSSWDVRDYILRREVFCSMARLVFIAWGYREPDGPAPPEGEYPRPD